MVSWSMSREIHSIDDKYIYLGQVVSIKTGQRNQPSSRESEELLAHEGADEGRVGRPSYLTEAQARLRILPMTLNLPFFL